MNHQQCEFNSNELRFYVMVIKRNVCKTWEGSAVFSNVYVRFSFFFLLRLIKVWLFYKWWISSMIVQFNLN